MWHIMEIKELLYLKYPCDWAFAIKLPHINLRNVVGLQTKVGVYPFLIHLPCVLIMNFMGCVSIGSHSWIAAGVEPDAHQFYVMNNLNGAWSNG
jgi:hypothetical protein